MATTTATKNKRKPAHGARLTGEQNAEKGFTATKELGDNLQKVLVDLIELASQGKQAHWNVIGTNFRDTHLQLDEIIDAAREFSDTIAERMRALHALPDGRSDTVAESTTLPEFPQGEIATTERARKRVEYDVYYIENWSPLLDIRIMIETVLKLIWDKNAY